MTPEQYLDAHPAEAFAEIAEAMGNNTVVDDDENVHAQDSAGAPFMIFDPINNAEQALELAVFLFKRSNNELCSDEELYGNTAMDHENALLEAMVSDNPPRELVLVAMEMLGIGESASE